MKFAVYGAGAIGAFLGSRLVEAGHEVVLIARGRNLAAIEADGLRVESEAFGGKSYRIEATADPNEIGPVDWVVLAVKAHALTEIAPLTRPLRGPGTSFLTTQNGLPWWYFHGMGEGRARMESVDPGGLIEAEIPAERAVGSIVYLSCESPAPGVVRHTQGVRLPVGEPDGSRSERVKILAEAFRGGGIKAPIRADIRHELWVKLLGNAVFNPLSALTRKTMIEMLDNPGTRELMRAAMEETREVAAAAGTQLAFSVEQRLEGARAAGRHKTSMLQDLEAGRRPELEPLTGAVIELARRYHVEAPRLQTIYAAARLLFEPSKSE